ncbi:YciI family protein [Solimonas marina]|uniref:YCII-related domain-containing protein n=1 Tax=Solimonas marina TaxID=2714601 RepID=A0A969WBJ3_9GAMM|nr:YciI family protein [Solimonas marina]NKF23080.1 hypothetical protein [Solimonas marina]
MQQMLRLPLYVVQSRPLGDVAAMRAKLHAHLRYMIDLEAAGVLFASGPYVDEAGGMDGAGMTILRAINLEAATAIARRDPMVVAGLRTVEVRRWLINEGVISLNVRFSQGSASLS